VTTHQANHARILRLKETNDALNQHITSTLTLLADSRKELLATPATVFPENQRNVPYSELLDYAKRISRFTVPPTFRIRAPAAAPAQPTTTEAVNRVSDATVQGGNTTTAHGENDGHGIGISSLEQKEVEWLDPLNQIPFVPWPSEEVIKRGALVQIQAMLEQGIDPAGVGSGGDEAVKEMRDADVKHEGEHMTGVVDGHDEVSRPPVSGPVQIERKEEKPKVFGGLDLYDPDEEG